MDGGRKLKEGKKRKRGEREGSVIPCPLQRRGEDEEEKEKKQGEEDEEEKE